MDPAKSSRLADVPSMFWLDPLLGSSWTGLNGGGAEEMGVAAMGSVYDGGGVEEDIYKSQLN
jgi:hypothetical protein